MQRNPVKHRSTLILHSKMKHSLETKSSGGKIPSRSDLRGCLAEQLITNHIRQRRLNYLYSHAGMCYRNEMAAPSSQTSSVPWDPANRFCSQIGQLHNCFSKTHMQRNPVKHRSTLILHSKSCIRMLECAYTSRLRSFQSSGKKNSTHR